MVAGYPLDINCDTKKSFGDCTMLFLLHRRVAVAAKEVVDGGVMVVVMVEKRVSCG